MVILHTEGRITMVTDRQVRRLHAMLQSRKPLSVAAMRLDMDRKTARKYRNQAKLPSELETWLRTWRTREDPFADVWEEVGEQLELSPGLQAKFLFEWLPEERAVLRPLRLHAFAAGAEQADGSDRKSRWHHPSRVRRSD